MIRLGPPAVFALALCSCAPHAPQAEPSPTPGASSAAAAKPVPKRAIAVQPASSAAPLSASPAPTPTPTPVPSSSVSPATPAAAASPASSSPPPIVYLSPDTAPQILQYRLSATTVHGGDTVRGVVYTSSNVASVEMRVGNYSVPMSKSGVGTFALTYNVPQVPFFLHRTYTMVIVAHNSRGDAVTRDVPITVE